MTLTEKLQAVIRFGQYSWAMDRTTPVHLYYYKYDNEREDKADPLNGKMVFDLSIPGRNGAAEFHGETLEEAVDKALAYLLRRRRETAEEVRAEATRTAKAAAVWEEGVDEFEKELTK
jgi:hypothetical protein